VWINDFLSFTQPRRGFDVLPEEKISRGLESPPLIAALSSCRFQNITSKRYLGQALIFDLAAVQNKPNLTLIAPPALQARPSEGPWRPIEQVLPLQIYRDKNDQYAGLDEKIEAGHGHSIPSA
jgi:hypothetical protein